MVDDDLSLHLLLVPDAVRRSSPTTRDRRGKNTRVISSSRLGYFEHRTGKAFSGPSDDQARDIEQLAARNHSGSDQSLSSARHLANVPTRLSPYSVWPPNRHKAFRPNGSSNHDRLDNQLRSKSWVAWREKTPMQQPWPSAPPYWKSATVRNNTKCRNKDMHVSLISQY